METKVKHGEDHQPKLNEALGLTTKATWLGTEYGCRVYRGNKVVVEGRCVTKDMIAPTFRDLLRTLDKMGGDKFTAAARTRKFKEGNIAVSIKHLWGGYKPNDRR